MLRLAPRIGVSLLVTLLFGPLSSMAHDSDDKSFEGTWSLGLATATSSATFFPHCEQRTLVASFASVTDLRTIRASASGSMCRDAPHEQVTRTMKSPRASSSFLM